MIATATPADEERRARKRERDLAKARREAARKREADRRTRERELTAWKTWCRESAAAFGALRRAREEGDPKAIERARVRDIALLKSMPPNPYRKKEHA